MDNLDAVTKEVKLMLDPNADPFANPSPNADSAVGTFGAKDATDLNWVQLLNSYSCTYVEDACLYVRLIKQARCCLSL